MTAKTFWVGLLITVTVPLLTALTAFSPDSITDWRSWVVGLAAASVRQAAVYVLAKIGGGV